MSDPNDVLPPDKEVCRHLSDQALAKVAAITRARADELQTQAMRWMAAARQAEREILRRQVAKSHPTVAAAYGDLKTQGSRTGRPRLRKP